MVKYPCQKRLLRDIIFSSTGSSAMARRTINCVLVGDGAVGKMCMAQTYATGKFPEEYVPVVHKVLTTTVTIGTEEVALNLVVTAGQDEYDRLRTLSYDGVWIREVRNFRAAVPIVLVGLKLDLRSDETESQRLLDRKEHPVSTMEGKQLAETIGAKAYLECSAKTGENLTQTIKETVKVALSNTPTWEAQQRRSVVDKCSLS